MKKYLITICVMLILQLGFNYALAQSEEMEKDKRKELWDGDRFYLRLGGYLLGYNEAKLSISSPHVLGVNLDIRDDLNMDDPGGVGRIDGYYRFKKNHALGFSYYSFKSEGATKIGKEIPLPDPDNPGGTIIFPVGANVQSSLDTEILKLNYIWSFYRSDRAGMALNAGLHITRLETRMRGEVIVGDPLSVNDVDTDVTAPLPVLGFRFSYKPLDKLRLMLENNVFFLSYGNYDGLYLDSSILAEYRIWKHVGIGGGFNFNSLDIKAKDDDSDRQLDLQHSIGAAQLYVFFMF